MVHRAENTDDPEKQANIVGALNELNTNIILPLHPRTVIATRHEEAIRLPTRHCDREVRGGKQSVVNMGLPRSLRSLAMTLHGSIITDSGGIQKEAYFLQKPCITLREQIEWVETVESGWNILAGSNKETIKEAFKNIRIPKYYPNYYGDGNTGNEIPIQLYLLLN